MSDQGSSRDMRSLRWGVRGTAAATFASRVTFENVSLSFGEVEAVKNVSFELKQGEIVCLLGPSGCGKSTLLRIAAGVEVPEQGRVLLDGKEVAGPSAFVPPEKRGVGLMFQDFALFPHLTILENVAFGLKSLDRASARREALNGLRRVGLEAYADSYPHQLSGGEQQRVALARAIVPRPAVMLMDEPFSGLDQRLRDRVRHETLQLLRETRATSIFVTHDPMEAMGIADRILLMRRGELVQTGTPEELYHQPVDVDAARFFGDYNELHGRAQGGRVETPVGVYPSEGFADGTPVTVLIRPQGIVRSRISGAGFEGYVLDSRFLGDHAEVLIEFPGLDDPLVAHVPIRDTPSRGLSARFAFDPDHILVFANTAAHAHV
ncbi:MAG: ABC transporter ATP-binding protein [Hyphomicrobiales bacterium]